MDETYGTYVDDECFDIHDYDDDTDHDTDDVSGLFGVGEGLAGPGTHFHTHESIFHHKIKLWKKKNEFLYDRKVVINRCFIHPV